MKMFALIVALSAAVPFGFVGCDRTVSETSHSSTDANGVTKTDSKTVTQDPGRGVTVTKEKTVSNP